MFFLRRAVEEDRKWMNACSLGVSGEQIDNVDDYFIVDSMIEQKPIGMLAVELHEKIAYLHSMRFTNGAPSIEQLGGLLDHLIIYCQKQGKEQLCLVVPSASEWMLELGFVKLDEVPSSVEESAHYQQVALNGMLLSYRLTP
jgi:N-acetylglutamate synthase-like GNAT family acetyltransferase